MNYADLCSAISRICETSFETEDLNQFISQAETKIYQTVGLLPMEAEATGVTVSGTRYVAFPTGFVSPISLSLTVSSNWVTLLEKDVSFIREAYPNPATTGVPQHYALYDTTQFLLGPTPGAVYTVNIRYEKYPESIVTAGTTWLGDNFDPALLNGALMEAIRFQKGEEADIANYEKMYMQSIGLLKMLGEGKLRQDMYRAGYPHTKVS